MLALLTLVFFAQSPDSLTLEQALARARARRPQVLLAAATVDRAYGAKRVLTTVPNPSTQFEQDDLDPTRKITVSQPLAWLPRYGSDLAAGRALIARAAADSVQLMADLARDVRLAFFTALAAEERLRLMLEQAAAADSLVTFADTRVSAGDISVLERDQIAQEARRAQLNVSLARESAFVARLDFGRAVAWTGDEPPRAAGSLDLGLPDEAAEASTSGNVSDIPVLRAAVADSAAAAARLRSARIAQLPIPALMAGQEWNHDPTVRRNLLLGFALPIPLWNHAGGAVAEARATAEQESARTSEARLRLRSQLDGARIRLVESAARARLARDSMLPTARQLRAGAIRLYESGRTGILPVLEALRSEREVAQIAVQEVMAFQQARADLNALLGRW